MSACLFSHDPPERTATGMLSISSVFPTKRSMPALTFISVFSASIFGRWTKVELSPVLTQETVKFVECEGEQKKKRQRRCTLTIRDALSLSDNGVSNLTTPLVMAAPVHILEIASIECVSVCHPPLYAVLCGYTCACHFKDVKHGISSAVSHHGEWCNNALSFRHTSNN